VLCSGTFHRFVHLNLVYGPGHRLDSTSDVHLHLNITNTECQTALGMRGAFLFQPSLQLFVSAVPNLCR